MEPTLKAPKAPTR